MAASEEILGLDSANLNKTGKIYMDPADYIFEHKGSHDVIFIVGRNVEKTERISAVTAHLVAHSSVFRQLLGNSRPATEVRITDVSPEVFKIILRHVYGGELPSLDRPTAAQLALAASLYKIRPLVARACALIVPQSPADVFPALVCVANISCPELQPHVSKIVQQQTQAVLSSEQFLDLDAKCLEYVSRQTTLSVSELELWRAVVRWATHRAATDSDKTARQHVQSTLQHVRLSTFSTDEIIKEVIPANILTPEEVVGLLTAVSSKQVWESPGFCNNKKNRQRTVTAQDHKQIPPQQIVTGKDNKQIPPQRITRNPNLFTKSYVADMSSDLNVCLAVNLKELQRDSFGFPIFHRARQVGQVPRDVCTPGYIQSTPVSILDQSQYLNYVTPSFAKLIESELQTKSSLTINTTQMAKIEFLMVMSKPPIKGQHYIQQSIHTASNAYILSCVLSVNKVVDGLCEDIYTLQIEHPVDKWNSLVNLPLKSLTLEANSCYEFTLKFNSPHPVYELWSSDNKSFSTFKSKDFNHMEAQHTLGLLPHIRKIVYSI